MPHEIITVISDIKHYEIIMIFMISLRISRAVPSSRLQSHCAELQITISAFHRLRSTSARRARASRTTNMRAPRNTRQHNTTPGARRPHRTQPSVRTSWSTLTPARHLHDPTDPRVLYSVQLSALENISTGPSHPWRSLSAHSAAMLCSVHPESELQQLTAPVARGSERAHT